MFHVRKSTLHFDMLRIANVSCQKEYRELECAVTELVEEEEEMFIPDKEDNTWMLASTRTAPYYWLLHGITMVSIVRTMHIYIIVWIIVDD